jgi:hypothetical protein
MVDPWDHYVYLDVLASIPATEANIGWGVDVYCFGGFNWVPEASWAAPEWDPALPGGDGGIAALNPPYNPPVSGDQIVLLQLVLYLYQWPYGNGYINLVAEPGELAEGFARDPALGGGFSPVTFIGSFLYWYSDQLYVTGEQQLSGACCYPNGSCAPTAQPDCTAVWHPGWDCSEGLCQSTRACCYPDGSCAVTTQAACTGIWHSEWTNCSVAQCPQLAACCFPNGFCQNLAQAACAATCGAWHPEWANCSVAQCAQPTAACCYPDGSCAVTTEVDCAGLWHLEWPDCSAAQCPLPTAACCYPDGSCAVTTQAACTGVWHSEWPNCSVAQCPQIFGACCDDYTGACNDGIEWGDCLPPLRFTPDMTCAQIDPPCGIPGACCNAGLECLFTGFEPECDAAGGEFYPGQTCPEFDCMPPYCSSHATSTADETLKNVTFGTINNTTTNCDTYDNFTNLSTDVIAGSTYPFNIVIGDCESASCYSKRLAIFIDLNQDYDFTDPGERVYLSAALPNMPCPDFPLAGNITISPTATVGCTRMRVIVDETSWEPPPCGTYTWGATEDYTVCILPPPPQGACCFPDGHCELKTPAQCPTAGGTFLGIGTDCDPNPCPQPGACCYDDGTCAVTFETECLGMWQGAGTDCDPNPCPSAGACCLITEECQVRTESSCTQDGGLYLGDGTACGECANEPDLDQGESTTLNPGGGSGDPTQDALVTITNTGGPPDASITVGETTSNPHPEAGGFAVLGRTLVIDTSLANGQFFMTVQIPFAEADLPPETDPLTVDLTYFNAATGNWVLAVDANTQNSPGHPGPRGDRFGVLGDTPPQLSPDLGDYGVFWNPAQHVGFAWANVDHATDFAPGVAPPQADVACCFPNGMCAMLTAAQCAATGGTPGEYGSDCTPNECPPCAGDLNCDGVVDFGDINPFVLILSNFAAWQQTYPGCPWQNGDIDGNGGVGFEDINPFVALIVQSPSECQY